jgi:hypothetical protein
MGVTVTLSSEELAQVRQLTEIDSGSEAVDRAAREFLRLCQLRQLQSVSGHVENDDDWKCSVSLEPHEIGFPRQLPRIIGEWALVDRRVRINGLNGDV